MSWYLFVVVVVVFTGFMVTLFPCPWGEGNGVGEQVYLREILQHKIQQNNK